MLLPRRGFNTHKELETCGSVVLRLQNHFQMFGKQILNNVLLVIIHKDQSYCIKDRSIVDNLHLVRDRYGLCS